MVTFLVCADMHLDSLFALFPKASPKAAQRREEQKAVFRRIIMRAAQKESDFLLIPGDLWDQPCPDSDTLAFLQEQFRSIPKTRVIITPGNHDPATPNSPYRTEAWPENVTVYTGALEQREWKIRGEKVCLSGAAFTGHFQKESLLSPLPTLDREALQILVMHGDLDAPGSSYNPLSSRDLAECGFHFCALGHVHKTSGIRNIGNTWFGYSGIPEGRGFDEAGDCGIWEGTLRRQTDGSVQVQINFLPTGLRACRVQEVDISSCLDNQEVLDEVEKRCPPDDSLYKIILRGTRQPGVSQTASGLVALLADRYYYVKIQDRSSTLLHPEQLAQEHTLKGIFVRDWLEQKKRATEGSAEAQLLDETLQLGLQLFEQDLVWDD